MSDIQRYDKDGFPDPEGIFVYADDHVASVAAAEQVSAATLARHAYEVRGLERDRIRKAVEALWVQEITHGTWYTDELHIWPSKAAVLAVIDEEDDDE
jgi:hypothetical protein